MPVFTIEFESEFYEALKEHAKSQGKPLTKLVRAWCVDALNPPTPATPKRPVGRPASPKPAPVLEYKAFPPFEGDAANALLAEKGASWEPAFRRALYDKCAWWYQPSSVRRPEFYRSPEEEEGQYEQFSALIDVEARKAYMIAFARYCYKPECVDGHVRQQFAATPAPYLFDREDF
jgi:hypothetical protein